MSLRSARAVRRWQGFARLSCKSSHICCKELTARPQAMDLDPKGLTGLGRKMISLPVSCRSL